MSKKSYPLGKRDRFTELFLEQAELLQEMELQAKTLEIKEL